MNICMVGAGYVGLVSAACFSEFGWTVTCIDKDAGKIDRLRQGHLPIYEPRLDELLLRNVQMGRLSFSTELGSAVRDADLVLLAVGTPMRRGDGHADLSFVYQAVEDISPHLTGFTVVATKSTVPVGTSREIEQRLKKLRPDADFAVCSNPEFLREGSAVYDFMHPDRVLVGCD
ncbi:MAG: 3-hydroxyacyl-CoA dehydrogenase NAD-binding domain-containing protein, partial [Methyloceanibacter sp.]